MQRVWRSISGHRDGDRASGGDEADALEGAAKEGAHNQRDRCHEAGPPSEYNQLPRLIPRGRRAHCMWTLAALLVLHSLGSSLYSARITPTHLLLSSL